MILGGSCWSAESLETINKTVHVEIDRQRLLKPVDQLHQADLRARHHRYLQERLGDSGSAGGAVEWRHTMPGLARSLQRRLQRLRATYIEALRTQRAPCVLRSS